MTNQTVLITGASSGIGFELARCFARDQYRLVLSARPGADLQEAAQKLQQEFAGVQTIVIPADLSTHEGPVQLFEETQRQGLQIDILVNDAGFGEAGLFVETDLQKEMGIVHVNVLALMTLTKLFLREMVTRNSGKILQLGSVVSFLPNPRQAVYAATKAFVLSFSEALQHELKEMKSEVTMTILCPPATETDFFRVANAEDTKVGQSKKATPEEVAEGGYKGLLNGEARVLPTFGAKLNFASSALFSDSLLATMMNTQMQPEKE
ncbi:SDR family NAD(P)-dependent oxidoreductase [Hymenobacter cellulosilyticus]|uniref:SDR family oxidoreductase n=1 Tax=Hymenobacter cellulosilyticus TaxID=2932248 RepID=A0A8T9Q946_9BACT|nr:SDR family oxidoreductase [Hymenobacter cellulosilyticus]UOQ72921.1 SDR family oxidoreductase [Hymenobacter cellulosilyticus]